MPINNSVKKSCYVAIITMGLCLILVSIILLSAGVKIEWLDDPGTNIIILLLLAAGIILFISGVYDYYKLNKK